MVLNRVHSIMQVVGGFSKGKYNKPLESAQAQWATRAVSSKQSASMVKSHPPTKPGLKQPVKLALRLEQCFSTSVFLMQDIYFERSLSQEFQRKTRCPDSASDMLCLQHANAELRCLSLHYIQRANEITSMHCQLVSQEITKKQAYQ